MYILSPVGYPIARLLDYVLGTYHDRTFSREGLKTLVMLHEVPRPLLNSPERLFPAEVSAVCNILTVSAVAISQIMIPLKSIFTLSADTYLNDIVMSDIVTSGLNMIPVHETGDDGRIIGLLNVRGLIGWDVSAKEVLIGQLDLEEAGSLVPEVKLTEALGLFRGLEMVMVSEDGRPDGRALGFVTFRTLMESCALGREMNRC
jgi:metal transporter CNNM